MSTENTQTPRMNATYEAFISMQPISAENVTKHIQLILNEGTKIETELAAANAQVLALREALEAGLVMQRPGDIWSVQPDKIATFLKLAKQALSAPPPPVVAKEVYDAAEKDAEGLADAARQLKAAKGRFNTSIAYGKFLDAFDAHEARKPITLASHFGYKPEDFAKFTKENAHKLP